MGNHLIGGEDLLPMRFFDVLPDNPFLELAMNTKLTAVLAEYEALRAAVLNNFRLQLQIYAIYASGLLVFYGLVIEHGAYDVMMAIPIFSMALLFRVSWHEAITRQVSEYICEMEEKKIHRIVGPIDKDCKELTSSNLCIGWQHYWNERSLSHGWPKYWEYSARMLFVGFSVVPAVLYGCYNVIAPRLDNYTEISRFGVKSLLFLLLVNTSLGCYMWYRITHVFPRRKPSENGNQNNDGNCA